MINWLALSYDDVVVLSILAYDHGLPLSDIVRNLHLLDAQERRIVEMIIDSASQMLQNDTLSAEKK